MTSRSSLVALLTSAAILFVGGGLNAVLIPVRAALEAFSTLAIGMLGTSAAVGIIAGCVLTPRLIGRVGHVRAFAVLAAVAAVVTLLHGLFPAPWFWILLRVPTGLCFAGLATVIESWLNAAAGNAGRGRVMGVYMIIQLAMQTSGQLLLVTADPAALTLFAVVAVAITASLVPIGLTRAIVPGPVAEVRLRPRRLYERSPSGVVGAVALGVVNSAFWALAPLYAQRVGLEPDRIAVFMSVAVVSGALLQYPFGRLSDHIDRRRVMVLAAAIAAVASAGLAVLGGRAAWAPFVLVAFFGAAMFALYPLCVAHVNDHVAEGGFVEASSGLLLLQGLGSIAGPILAAAAMGLAGAGGLFFFAAAVLAGFIAFVVRRLAERPTLPLSAREPFVVLPETGPGGLDLDPRASELDAQRHAASSRT